jgi:metal-responsive CopG/Arc/MetJ family transcriptional regulator
MQGEGEIMKQKVSLTLDEEIIKEIDKKRGLIPRSTFVEQLLKKVLEVVK